MGRYTSVKAFSDSNTKLVSLNSGTAITSSSTTNEDGSSNTNEGNKPIGTGNKLITERVHNVSGSCAGASSSEFDKYRAARNREVARLKSIELNDQQMVEAEINQQRINKNKSEAEERERKNAEKRNKKKRKLLKKRELSKLHRTGTEQSNGEDDDEEDESEKSGDDINDTVGSNESAEKVQKQSLLKAVSIETGASQHNDDSENVTTIVKSSTTSIHTYKRKSEEL